MQINTKRITLVFIAHVIFFILIVLGILPRIVTPFFTIIIALYVLGVSLAEGTLFFVQSIPLFIALSVPGYTDSLNMWRIISIVIFLKWFGNSWRNLWVSLLGFIRKPFLFVKQHPTLGLCLGLLVMAFLSIIVASRPIVSLLRVILFVNLSFIGIVVYDLLKKNQYYINHLIRAIGISVIVVTLAGFVQLIFIYFIDIYGFVRIWGAGVQCRQFGDHWCFIALYKGNTWFAYYGDQLTLRMFSLFPDSHSFPIYVLLGLPALLAWSLELIPFHRFREAIWVRTRLLIVFVPLGLLAAILSGTRGIWAAWVGVGIFTIGLLWYSKRKSISKLALNILKYVSIFVPIFLMLFVIAYPIFDSPQFQSPARAGRLSGRLRSIANFGETSNAQRIAIWKASISSIAKRPFLGVGIANFPVILDQDVSLTKAGSSAHNLYIHIAAEMGLIALVIALLYLLQLIRSAWKNFADSQNSIGPLYFAGILIFVPWVLLYLLTDIALFDERAFLLFTVTSAIIFGYHASSRKSQSFS